MNSQFFWVYNFWYPKALDESKCEVSEKQEGILNVALLASAK